VKSATSDEMHEPDVVVDYNLSERFECRFSTVRIERSPSIMLQGMEGCILGIWIAHGEGLLFIVLNSLDMTEQKPGC
jgi:phosphoribosylformylglycinamidine (FGAM) synthase-like amidotransferase family enzyme